MVQYLTIAPHDVKYSTTQNLANTRGYWLNKNKKTQDKDKPIINKL